MPLRALRPPWTTLSGFQDVMPVSQLTHLKQSAGIGPSLLAPVTVEYGGGTPSLQRPVAISAHVDTWASVFQQIVNGEH